MDLILLPFHGFWGLNSGVRLGGKHIYLLNHPSVTILEQMKRSFGLIAVLWTKMEVRNGKGLVLKTGAEWLKTPVREESTTWF